MAHTITKTTYQLSENGHRAIYHISLISDGVTADLNKYVIVDPVTDLGLTSAARLAIESVEYNFIGFDAYLDFDSGNPTDDLAWCLARGLDSTRFNPDTGVKDQSGLDGTGKIQLNTVGFSAAGSLGTIIIKVRKS